MRYELKCRFRCRHCECITDWYTDEEPYCSRCGPPDKLSNLRRECEELREIESKTNAENVEVRRWCDDLRAALVQKQEKLEGVEKERDELRNANADIPKMAQEIDELRAKLDAYETDCVECGVNHWPVCEPTADAPIWGPSPMRRVELVQEFIEAKLIEQQEALAILGGLELRKPRNVLNDIVRMHAAESGPGLRAKGGIFTEAGRDPEPITVDLSGDYE